MIGLLLISLVLLGAVAFLTSAALGAALPWLTARLAVLEPTGRIRVLAGLLASPGIAGALVLLLSLGPCLSARLAGLPDTCAEHGGPHLYLCLQHGGHPSALAWLLGGLLFARAGYVIGRVGHAARTTSRLARLLRQAGSIDVGGGYFVVPGWASFTAGWPRGSVFVGSDLIGAVEPVRLAIVVAHEQTHQRRRHVLVKLVARAMAVFHLPNVGKRLADELDAALEQSCDLEAARQVGDPLLVAESLVAVARLYASSPAGVLAGFSDDPDTLARRVSALCSPPWKSHDNKTKVALWVGLNGALLLALALIFDRELHDVTEALLQILAA